MPSSPYINHFLQPDTVVPGFSNPQSWNRFSYATNNPLRYNDPSGHRPCGDGETVNCSGQLNNPPLKRPDDGCGVFGHTSCLGNNNDYPDIDLSNANNPQCKVQSGCERLPSPLEYFTSQVPFTSEQICDYFHISGMCNSNAWNSFVQNAYPPIPLEWFLEDLGDAAYSALLYGLNAGANVTQDLAVVVDVAGVVVEGVLLIAGCVAGGVLGCGAGILAADAAFVSTGANGAETVLSTLWLGFTYAADTLDDGQLGEAFTTSLTTWAVGGLSPDPALDLAIDLYASGYNHGVFCGINSISNGNCHR